jgi:membrane peptidoglycan carboxypeptidase
VKFEDMSEDFVKAVVAIEDHRFYSHSGIDILATAHAIFVNIRYQSFDFGASTITQQLGRLLYFTQERQLNRKIAELFVSLNLEKEYSKEEILELYVNIIYYGKGCYGIKSASEGYFDKLPSELTFEEATYLAGLPNAPSVYSVDDKKGEERRIQVVEAMEKYKDELTM